MSELWTYWEPQPEDFFEVKGTDKLGKKKLGRFIPAKLAKDIYAHLLSNYLVTPETLGPYKTMWFYHDDLGYFKQDGGSRAEQWVEETLGEKATPQRINQVVSLLKVKTYVDPDLFNAEDVNKVVCLNGVINIAEEKLESYDQDLFAKGRINVNYDPSAKAPAIEKFLEEVGGKYKITLIEYIGYCLWKAVPIARFFAAEGTGANGKSTFISLVEAFLGSDNISYVTLQQLTENRFKAAQLHGKMANLHNDISRRPIKDSGVLKTVTDGNRMSAEFKYGSNFKFEPYAKVFVACNELPQTYDQSSAFFRRPVRIPFDNVFIAGSENCDQNILEKLTTEEELSGLLNLALKALKDLLERGTFTHELTLEEKKLDWIKNSDPAQYFILSEVELDLGGFEVFRDMYTAYVDYCLELGKVPVTDTTFSKKCNIFLPYKEQRRRDIDGKKNVKVWMGVRLKSQTAKPKPDIPKGQTGLPTGICTNCGRTGLPLVAVSRSKKLCPRCRGEWEAPQ